MGCFPGRRSRRRLRIAARELEVVGGKTRLPLTSICRAFMAEPETATLAVASLPSSDELERAASFTREPFLLEGEDPYVALASGPPRRAALDWALSELADGREVPSTKWRGRGSLLLGVDRLLPQDGPAVGDAPVLPPHPVDARSGPMSTLFAECRLALNETGTTARSTDAGPEEPLLLAS